MEKILLFIKNRKKSFFALLFAIFAFFGMAIPGPQQDYIIELFDTFFMETQVEQPTTENS